MTKNFNKKHGSILILPVIAVITVITASYLLWRYANTPKTPDLPRPPLKELSAKHGIKIGNHAIKNRIGEKPYNDILTQQFDFVTIDNTPNWHFTDYDLRPSKDKFDFSQIDKIMAYAEKNKMPVQMHHYLWGDEKWLPNWLLKGKFTPAQLEDIMKNHILTVGKRYSGRVAEWTVVNEAFTRQQHLFNLNDWWAVNTGSQDYIDKAFFWARQADPKSKLILNDFNNEIQNNTSNAMYEYMKGAKARGVPIDGIGMQMHLDGTHPPKLDEVKTNMTRFGDLGYEVYITELDVNMNDVKADDNDKDQIQARIYYEVTKACIESKVCHSYALLGITDAETWYNYLPGVTDARPLPFDRKYKPKPAFYELRRALEE